MKSQVLKRGFGLCLLVTLGGACTNDEAAPSAGNSGGPSGGGGASASPGGSTPGGTAPSHAGAGDSPTEGGASGSDGHDGAGAGGSEDVMGQGGGDGSSVSLQQLIDEYPSWQALSEPYDVSAQILSLCRAPTANEDAFVESEHSGFALRHFANPPALEAIDHASNPFVEGSAIVKEKLGYRAGSNVLEVLALGIMVKRNAGFDAASGDWQFAYYSETDGILSDEATQTACASCHASSSAKDFVFVDQEWRSGEDFP